MGVSYFRSARRRATMLSEVRDTNARQRAISVMAPPWSGEGWIEISTLDRPRSPREYDHLLAAHLIEMREPGPVTGWQVRLTTAGLQHLARIERKIDALARRRKGGAHVSV